MLELNERKKFRTNAIRHGRSRKRTDSCPETSEANTPGTVFQVILCMLQYHLLLVLLGKLAGDMKI